MNEPITIAEATENLVSDPRPVLYLDTCDFLDVVRSFEEDGNRQSEMVRRLVGSRWRGGRCSPAL